MIHPAIFAAEMRLLQERFNRRDLTRETLARYHEYLTPRLTDAQFQHAARTIFNTDTFWPSPERFIDAAHGGAITELAERDWQRVLTTARAGKRLKRDHLPAPVRAGLAAAPMHQIHTADEAYELPRLRSAFIAAYTLRARIERSAPHPTLEAPAGPAQHRKLPAPPEDPQEETA